MSDPRNTPADNSSPVSIPISSSAGPPPLYIEVGPMCCPPLTGIGGFVARLVEALSQSHPLRLVTTVQEDLPWGRFAKLRRGQDLPINPGELPPADGDLVTWTRAVLQRPTVPHDRELAARSTALYTMLRPAEKHFKQELAILYDFTPLIVPWTHTPLVQARFGAFFGRDLALCDKAIAISQATKADARWLSPLDDHDVHVGYPGPSLCVHGHAEPHPVKRKKNIILVVSTLEPRKNGRFLLDWFPTTTAFDNDMELWWVGPKGWMCDLTHVQASSPRHRKIRFMGMVSDRKLCELYQQAAFTIYPSLYEGFGFPVLDSLRHNTPVVSSFNSSLQEFASPGVFYFDPYDKASLDSACREVVGATTGAAPLVIDRNAIDQRFGWPVLAKTVLDLCRQSAAA